MSVEAESGHVQYLVLGIGLNVHQGEEDFSAEVSGMATSLRMALGRRVSRPLLAAAEIEAVDRLYTDLRAGNLDRYLSLFRRDCVNLGKTVQLLTADGRREEVRALDIGDDFSLVVQGREGRRRNVSSGEVSVRGMYGYV